MQAEPQDGKAILLLGNEYLPDEKQKIKNLGVYSDLDSAIDAFSEANPCAHIHSWWCQFARWLFKEYKG